jgi:dienelactone hydrolase
MATWSHWAFAHKMVHMIRFPTETLANRALRLEPTFNIVRPSAATFGDGPYPTTIMMHGCGDQNGPQIDYARSAATHGVASVIVDSYTSRRIDKAQAATLVCSGMRLWGRERAGDIFAALHFARQQNWVDQDALSLAGWSHGGWSVMDALALGGEVGDHAGITDLGGDGLAGVGAAFLVYPWCGAGAQTPSRGWLKPVRSFMILAEWDVVAGVRFPLSALRAAQKSGAMTESIVYPRATHCFDEVITLNPTFKYDPVDAARAITFYGQWISQKSD